MHDKFGDVMIENLKQRNCSLPSVSACASLQSQKSRYYYIIPGMIPLYNLRLIGGPKYHQQPQNNCK